jgi:Na+/melibiose symporter-like transporter
MKNIKQVLAILGIVLILGLNVLLVFAAGTASEDGMGMFGGAGVAVVMIPILLWIYLYIYKLIKKRREDEALEEELEK